MAAFSGTWCWGRWSGGWGCRLCRRRQSTGRASRLLGLPAPCGGGRPRAPRGRRARSAPSAGLGPGPSAECGLTTGEGRGACGGVGALPGSCGFCGPSEAVTEMDSVFFGRMWCGCSRQRGRLQKSAAFLGLAGFCNRRSS